ncbi:MAG: hypothetical protein JWR67_450 [Mucilaginibacter sp.]|nr:hypothetical protein [Mucilaginibacter sp.]
MKKASKQNIPKETERIKKVWAKPEVFLISQANVHGGAITSAHEAGFTPNHTNYAPNGAGPFPATVFNNYVS